MLETKRTTSGLSKASLASEALSVLAQRNNAGGACLELDRNHLQALLEAVCHSDPAITRNCLSDLRAKGVTDHLLTDLYIPQVARVLGERWCSDKLGFAEVTIGTARLQGILRDIQENTRQRATQSGPLVAVFVLENEHHTLGAMVVTNQLRRIGVSVRVIIGRSTQEITQITRNSCFDAFFISLANPDNADKTREAINCIRRNARNAAPIVVGGAAIDLAYDIKKQIGADIVTNDLTQALVSCGVSTPQIEAHSCVAQCEQANP